MGLVFIVYQCEHKNEFLEMLKTVRLLNCYSDVNTKLQSFVLDDILSLQNKIFG